MNDHEERAYRYRQKAEELRAILPDMKDPQYRQILEKIILDYERMANAQDMLAKP